MTFILRWPAILVLLALVLLSFAGAAAVAAELLNAPIALPQVQAAAAPGAAQSTWLDVGLWAFAGIFFLVCAIRLMRRTQGFWTWLLGFACYAGRWAYAEQQQHDLVAAIQAVNPSIYAQPQVVLADLSTFEAQLGILAVIVVVGLLIFIIDLADRAYWDKQGA
jgi:hypothetical protein